MSAVADIAVLLAAASLAICGVVLLVAGFCDWWRGVPYQRPGR